MLVSLVRVPEGTRIVRRASHVASVVEFTAEDLAWFRKPLSR